MTPGRVSDFDHLWLAARLLFDGQNPYPLMGTGRAYDPGFYLTYPASALVALSPIAALPLTVARIVFVGGSAALLCWGLTRDGWWRVAIFVSGPFFNAAGVAQWSVLVAAAFLIPKLAGIVAVKPTVGFAVLSSTASQRDQLVALLVAAALGAVSLLMLPSWPTDWLSSLKLVDHVLPPIAHIAVGGPLVLLAALRWRRPEARLLAALACIPQSTVIYEGLYFLLFPATPRGVLIFTALSWIPYFIQGWLVDHALRPGELVHWKMGNVMVLFFYLPALFMVLRRPNEGDVPRWLEASTAFLRSRLLGGPTRGEESDGRRAP